MTVLILATNVSLGAGAWPAALAAAIRIGRAAADCGAPMRHIDPKKFLMASGNC